MERDLRIATALQYRGAVVTELAIVLVTLLILLFGIFQIGLVLRELIAMGNSAYVVAMAGTDDVPFNNANGPAMESRISRFPMIRNTTLRNWVIQSEFNLTSTPGVFLPPRSFSVRSTAEVPVLNLGPFGIGDPDLGMSDSLVAPYLIPPAGAGAGQASEFRNPGTLTGCNSVRYENQQNQQHCNLGCVATPPLGQERCSTTNALPPPPPPSKKNKKKGGKQ